MKGKEYMILTNEKHFFFDFSIIDKILEPPMSRIESVRKICYIQFAILANDFNKGFSSRVNRDRDEFTAASSYLKLSTASFIRQMKK